MDFARSFESGIPFASQSLPSIYFSESHAAISRCPKIQATPGRGGGRRGCGGWHAHTRWDWIYVDRVEGAWGGLGGWVVGEVRVVVQEDFLLVPIRSSRHSQRRYCTRHTSLLHLTVVHRTWDFLRSIKYPETCIMYLHPSLTLSWMHMSSI
jgi:hypothetical protein